MDNGNSIHTNNVKFNNAYYEVHTVAASVHNNESTIYHTYNDTVHDTAIYDSVNTNTSCFNENECVYQLQDLVSSDTNSDTDSTSGAHQETPPPFSTIGKPMISPKPFDMSKSSSKSAIQISQVISYPLLEIFHEDNDCNCE